MATIPIGQVARVTCVQQEGAEFYVNRWHCEDPGPASHSALGLAFRTFYAEIEQDRPAVSDLTEVRIALFNGLNWTQVFLDTGSTPGTDPGSLPKQIAVRVGMMGTVDFGLRPVKGGIYLGPMGLSTVITDGRLANLARDRIGAAVINLDDSVKVLTGGLGIGVFSEVGVSELHELEMVRIDNFFDTQRSRRSTLSGPFTEYPPTP